MALVLANNAFSTLAGSITDEDTQLTVQTADAALFPAAGGGDWFPLTLTDGAGNMEIVYATARSSAVITITRGEEGTTPQAWDSGDSVSLRMTAGTIEAAIASKQDLATILTAIVGLSSTGLIARTGSGAVAVRTLTGPAAGITVTNGDGVSGNPTLALSADLAAVEALASTGLAARTASNTWAQRSVAAGTGISVNNGDGVSGNPTVALDTSVAARLNAEDQALTGGARITPKDLGTITSGTVTPDPGDRPMQYYVNNGAHTLAPGSNKGAYILEITNDASAGAITTSGWTKKVGSFTTTNGHKFTCSCVVGQGGSTITIVAMQ